MNESDVGKEEKKERHKKWNDLTRFQRLVKSFSHAGQGLKYVFKTQPNMRIHFWTGFIVIIAAVVFKINYIELAIISLTIGVVLIGELVNTGVEFLVDLVCPEYNVQAKHIKDIAAAVVLLCAVVSVVVGVIIFLPYILNLFGVN